MMTNTVSDAVYLNMIVSSSPIVTHDRQLTRVVAKLKHRLTLHSMNQHMMMCCWCVNHSCTLVCWRLTEISTKTQMHMWKFDWIFSQNSTMAGRRLVETSTKFRPSWVEVWLKFQPNFEPPCRNFNPLNSNFHTPVLQDLHCKTSGSTVNFNTSVCRNFNWVVSNLSRNFNQTSTPHGRILVEISTKFRHIKPITGCKHNQK